ncbi:MAG: hypothetical protein EP332_11015 [Bacteroidetes bacterium]|nr:MAG: hypothetical protein EP332_11015 [Bacteroidota bacterium]
MKPILYLGIVAICALSLQVYLETSHQALNPAGTEDNKVESARFKIEDGKIFFLTTDNQWVERDNYIWRADNGMYYKHLHGKLFSSIDGEQWQLVANLSNQQLKNNEAVYRP